MRQLGDVRPVWDEAALAELASPHDEERALGVDVAHAQPARLTGAQSESVAKGEDRPLRRISLQRPGVVGERGCGGEQPAGLRRVEDERDAPGARPPPAGLQRRGLQQLLGHSPVEQAPHDAEQAVKLRGRDLGRDARNSSRRADVSSSSAPTPCWSAKRTSRRSSRSSLRYLRESARLCARKRPTMAARHSFIGAPPRRHRGRPGAGIPRPLQRRSPSTPPSRAPRSPRSSSGKSRRRRAAG